MQSRYSYAIIILFGLLGNALGQQQNKQQEPRPTVDEVVRINTTLVQVDAVVTDKDGKQVTNLNAEDFEILEDGHPQQIKNFSYVSTVGAAVSQSPTSLNRTGASGRTSLPLPTVRLRPEQVRRTVVLLVDDLGLSSDSVAYVRQALKKYVAEQIQPGDLAAVICSSAGVGAMQQFTSDKRQLNAAIEHIRFYPLGRGRMSAIASLKPTENKENGMPLVGTETNYQINASEKEFFGGTMGALNYVIRGLSDFPGRKSIVLMSDNLPITSRETLGSGFFNAITNLIEQANRSSIVIYALDPRGLGKVGLSADDNQYDLAANQINARLLQRRLSYHPSQDGLNYLATQTGGMLFQVNDLSVAIQMAMEDQKGYYLLAYKPDESTLSEAGTRTGSHKLIVNLKRPGLTIRARNGFYAAPVATAPLVNPTRDEQMRGALNSPFTTGDIHVRATSLFVSDKSIGPYIRTMLHIDAHDITFSKDGDGWLKASLDFATVSFDPNGKVVDQVGRSHTMRVRNENFQKLLDEGFVYFTNLPSKKPGAFQLRAAVRDAVTARLGAASQFVEVPNLRENRLTLSGVIVNGLSGAPVAGIKSRHTSDDSSTNTIDTLANLQSGNARNVRIDSDTARLSPAVRRFKRDEMMEFGYYIYNARLNKAGLPQIQTQLRILRDGQPVFTGKLLPLPTDDQTDLKRIIAGGSLRLGDNLVPGDYVLQVIVVDLLAQDPLRVTSQWIDFEILP